MNGNLTCLRDPIDSGEIVTAKEGLISAGGRHYPVIRGIPRFVGAGNYSDDFGAKWNKFPKTQLDSFTGLDVSEVRLARCLQGNLTQLKGKKVLEAGSGAGRFTEILLKHGALLHSFDYSNAVEANAQNNGGHADLVLVQADIRKIPFPKGSYDYVVCLGVLQHTPDPEESIRCLLEMVAPGGALVIDHYPWKWRFDLPPPFGESIAIYRRLILALPKSRRFKWVKAITDFWFPWHWRFRDSLFAQRVLRRVSPVLFYYPEIKLPDERAHYEWSLLDTHDATTDFYKHRRTPGQIRKVLEGFGATEVVVRPGGNGVEAFCRKVDAKSDASGIGSKDHG